MAQVLPHQHHHRQPHHHLQLRHHHHFSQGVLGKLGNPGKVLGVDISEEMINHCSNHYSGQENLSFQVFTWSDINWSRWKSKMVSQFLPRPWMCQTEQTSAKPKSLPSTWQVDLSNPGIDLTRSPRSLASTGFQTNPMLSLSSTASSNLGGSFYLW